MAITISFTNIEITKLEVDYINQLAKVDYNITTAEGVSWKSEQAIFFVTMPVLEGEPVPENWYLLAAEYLPNLIALRDDADAAITARVLGG